MIAAVWAWLVGDDDGRDVGVIGRAVAWLRRRM